MRDDYSILRKIGFFVHKTLIDNPNTFLDCKTTQDVFLAVGNEKWKDVLIDCGYSVRFCNKEILNKSNRFMKLLDRITALVGEDYVDVVKECINYQNNKK